MQEPYEHVLLGFCASMSLYFLLLSVVQLNLNLFEIVVSALAQNPSPFSLSLFLFQPIRPLPPPFFSLRPASFLARAAKPPFSSLSAPSSLHIYFPVHPTNPTAKSRSPTCSLPAWPACSLSPLALSYSLVDRIMPSDPSSTLGLARTQPSPSEARHPMS